MSQGAINYQDSCLRGETNLVQLWQLGNGMKKHGFATEAAKIGKTSGNDEYDVGAPNVKALLTRDGKEKWDFVVFNDHTQGPARLESRDAMHSILLERYLPLIAENGATPVIAETAVYRYTDINNSKDLGTAHEFQRRVREGVESYVEALREKLPPSLSPRMAPVGTAYLRVCEENRSLWEELFDPFDHFHPSPIGTFLQGCVLHSTMFGMPPPVPRTDEEINALWQDVRMMHNPQTGSDSPLPTVQEVQYLTNVATYALNIARNSTD
ncbi:hypothetical protein ACHAWF_013757 [Thalassiosira exigua]